MCVCCTEFTGVNIYLALDSQHNMQPHLFWFFGICSTVSSDFTYLFTPLLTYMFCMCFKPFGKSVDMGRRRNNSSIGSGTPSPAACKGRCLGPPTHGAACKGEVGGVAAFRGAFERRGEGGRGRRPRQRGLRPPAEKPLGDWGGRGRPPAVVFEMTRIVSKSADLKLYLSSCSQKPIQNKDLEAIDNRHAVRCTPCFDLLYTQVKAIT